MVKKLLPEFIDGEKLVIVQAVHNDRKLFKEQQKQIMKKFDQTLNQDSIKTNRQAYIDTYNIDDDQLLNGDSISSIQWRTCLNERNQIENKQDEIRIQGDLADAPLLEETKKLTLKLFTQFSKDNEDEWRFIPFIDGIYFSTGTLDWKDVDSLRNVQLTGRIYSPFLIGNSIDFTIDYHDRTCQIEYNLNTIRTRHHQTSMIFKSKTRQNDKKLFIKFEPMQQRSTIILNKNELDELRYHIFGNVKYTFLSDYQFFEIFLSSIGIHAMNINSQNCFWFIYEMGRQKFTIRLRNRSNERVVEAKIKNDIIEVDKENIQTNVEIA